MTRIIQSIHKFENQLDDRAARFGHVHPYLAALILFVGLPVFVLGTVGACTAALMLPVSLLCGWL